MKNLKNIRLLFVLVASGMVVSSCGNKEKKEAEEVTDVVENEVSMELPNKSDIAFEKALMALDKNEYKSAAEHINYGAKELKTEAKDKGSEFIESVDVSINQLTEFSKLLEKGKKVDIDALRSVMANAEINVGHDYLVTDDTYILTEPEKVNDSQLEKVLDHNMKSLKAGKSKLTGATKKEGEKLEAQGEKLKEDYIAWKKRAKAHAKETEAYFKEHQPENVYPVGVFPLF
ncbi:hypothetical protein [Algibacter sp. L4_22]|uniref:hypothetical protein n=1 Tax=Algibacter sp. L4_22 TaxID=2942477 RepID=UPI00201B55C4|nr:hypothetical protein [Algibacter sp. L4_22]MCL5128248.1 hypothetical protein [Algibacter sp. L4_22]